MKTFKCLPKADSGVSPAPIKSFSTKQQSILDTAIRRSNGRLAATFAEERFNLNKQLGELLEFKTATLIETHIRKAVAEHPFRSLDVVVRLLRPAFGIVDGSVIPTHPVTGKPCLNDLGTAVTTRDVIQELIKANPWLLVDGGQNSAR